MIVTSSDEHAVLQVEEWRDLDILVTLDSGCCEHILDAEEVPGYGNHIQESPGSRRGQTFTVGNGAEVPNEGQVRVNLAAPAGQGSTMITSDFQVAKITRPLMSVSKVCEQGYSCLFTREGAQILDVEGKSVSDFQRVNGLYVATMKLKPPEPFRRPAT